MLISLAMVPNASASPSNEFAGGLVGQTVKVEKQKLTSDNFLKCLLWK